MYLTRRSDNRTCRFTRRGNSAVLSSVAKLARARRNGSHPSRITTEKSYAASPRTVGITARVHHGPFRMARSRVEELRKPNGT